MKLIINICSYVLLLVLLNSVNLTQQLPDLSVDKVSDVKVESDSKISGYKKAHGSHKEADSDGWKNLKSSSKGKLDKAKQDAEMYLGEGKHKVKKENGFHAESDLHKSKDKGMDKKWNRGDGVMKTWNWNKGGHLEEEEGGKWQSSVHHKGKKGKKVGSSKDLASDAGGSHYESSKKKGGSIKESGKKMEKHGKKEKSSKKWKSDAGKSASSVDKKIEKMKFDKYEKPIRGWNDESDSMKLSYHPSSYKGVDHGSIHGGRLSTHKHHLSKSVKSHKGKSKDSIESELGSIDAHLPQELKSLDDFGEELID